jgi:hypothetical protein
MSKLKCATHSRRVMVFGDAEAAPGTRVIVHRSDGSHCLIDLLKIDKVRLTAAAVLAYAGKGNDAILAKCAEADGRERSQEVRNARRNARKRSTRPAGSPSQRQQQPGERNSEHRDAP